jgi:hypothetical protein
MEWVVLQGDDGVVMVGAETKRPRDEETEWGSEEAAKRCRGVKFENCTTMHILAQFVSLGDLGVKSEDVRGEGGMGAGGGWLERSGFGCPHLVPLSFGLGYCNRWGRGCQ